MKPTDLSYHLTNYLSIYLPGTRGLSSNTIASRRDAFLLLLGFLRDKKGIPIEKVQIKSLTTKLIGDFLTWLENERGCSVSTRNQRLTSIKAFFKYLQAKTPEHILLCQQIMSMPLKKTGTKTLRYMTLEAVKAILDSVVPNTKSGYRDLILLSVLYDSGARVQEIADLEVGDIRLEKPETIRLTGKGKKRRIVPMMEPTAKLLSQYLARNNLNDTQYKQYPLFCNRSGRKLTRGGISYMVKKYVNLARQAHPALIPDVVSAHSFRHSKAFHMLGAGVPLIYIRDFLGHEEISTTEVYARCDSKMKREAFESAYCDIQSRKTVWHENDNLLSWLKSLC